MASEAGRFEIQKINQTSGATANTFALNHRMPMLYVPFSKYFREEIEIYKDSLMLSAAKTAEGVKPYEAAN